MQRLTLIIQARQGSTRLPGKVLSKVLGRSLLSYQIERLKRVATPSRLVVATTCQERDDSIVELCEQEGVECYRGSEENVLDRYFRAAKYYRASTVVRLTADCPLIDPAVVDWLAKAYFHSAPRCHYARNRGLPRGMDVEIFSFESLAAAHQRAKHPEEKEHVTPFIYRHPSLFNTCYFDWTPPLPSWRWTVDTSEDWELIRLLIEYLYPTKPHFTLADLAEAMITHPHWAEINSHVRQKELSLS